ncbi:MAG: hypothetical protein WC315_00335 [Candidatus Omnitrophota bacterium]|jgi:hypothetical protein
MKILKRRLSSGFVKYPKDFDRRIIDGTARFRTKCDMLVGPCACGGVHQEHDDWVQQLLGDNDAVIEPLMLAPEESGIILIPRYWLRPRGHERCTVLSGRCACGRNHTANERWVVDLLASHGAKLIGCKEVDLPPVGDVANEINEYDDAGGATIGCPCENCQHRRQNARFGRRLNRSQI